MLFIRIPFFLFILLTLLNGQVEASGCLNIRQPTGLYGLSLQGHLGDEKPYGAAGLLSLSKAGFTLKLTESKGGDVIQNQIVGTVALSDCALTLTGTGISHGFSLNGQLAERGNEILVTAISSTQPLVADGILRPVGLSNCSNKNLKGGFTFLSQGYQQKSGSSTPLWVPIGLVGAERFNGKGCSYYQDTVKQGDSISTASGLLMYSVATDCSINFIQDGVPHSYGVLENGGNTIAYVRVDSGTVRTGELSRIGSDSNVAECP